MGTTMDKKSKILDIIVDSDFGAGETQSNAESSTRIKSDGQAWKTRKPGAEFLNSLKVKSLKKAGMYGDGGGLYLRVTEPGAKGWILRVAVAGKRRDLGLGAYPLVTLSEAREEARKLRKLARGGIDPRPVRIKTTGPLTLEGAARQVYQKLLPTWSNARFADSWIKSLEKHVFPMKSATASNQTLGARDISSIVTADILAVLDPIWTVTNDTAKKVKQRLSGIFDWAKTAGHYQGENPVTAIKKASLPAVKGKQGHYDAMPWADVPAFTTALLQRGGTSASCLAFIIHTATRSGEARGARWAEVNRESGVWTIPASRMKARSEHRIPLTSAALAVLDGMRALDDGLIFPSVQRNKDGSSKIQSDMVFKALYRRMGVEGVTTHGFRSSFRDWCGESARADREVAEAALAHTLGNAVERAYARSDLFERRRELMDRWSSFLVDSANLNEGEG